MAELPRYQQTGRVFADVPQLDFANVRESYKLSQSMSGALDRLSEFAGKFAAKQVERQAEQYAIENPITIEQLQQAKQSGIDPDELIKATGGGAIWEDTLRKLQGEQLRAQLEVQGKGALTEIQALFDANQINDIAEVKSKFNSIIQGTAAPLARISPESAIKLQQSLGVTANAYYREATNKLAKDYLADQEIIAAKHLDYTNNASKALINTITDPILLTEARDLLRIRLYEQSREAGTGFAQKQVAEFDKQFNNLVKDKLISVATDSKFARNSTEALNKIALGQIVSSDGADYSAIFNTLDSTEKAKVRSYVRDQFIAINETRKQEELAKIDDLKAEANKVELDYYQTKNPALLNRLKRISFESDGKAISAKDIEAIKKSGEEKESESQYTDAVIQLKEDIRTGKIDSMDILYNRASTLGVSRKSVNKYVYSSFANKSDALKDEILSQYADMSNPTGSKAIKVRRLIAAHQQVDKDYEAQFEYNQLNPDKQKPIKPKSEIAAEYVDKTTKARSMANVDTQLNSLNNIVKDYGIKSFSKNSNYDEYTKQLIDKKIKDSQIKKEVIYLLEQIDKANNP